MRRSRRRRASPTSNGNSRRSTAWDQDETWKKAAEQAQAAAEAAQEVVAERCKEMGIPKTFAPSIGVSWQGRGENV